MTTKLGQDGKALRLCDEDGCSLRGKHCTNCNVCFGFGVVPGRLYAGRRIPISAGELPELRESGAFDRCPDCGGTPNGITEEVADG